MKIVMFGFEFVIRLKSTTETRISYVKWLTKMHQMHCRIFHDSTWVPKKFDASVQQDPNAVYLDFRPCLNVLVGEYEEP